MQDARGKGGDDKHLDRETIVSRGASARGKERSRGQRRGWWTCGERVLCACVRDRERRRYEERRDTGASVRERERRERVACEKGSGRESGGDGCGDDVDDGRIIHCDAQTK